MLSVPACDRNTLRSRARLFGGAYPFAVIAFVVVLYFRMKGQGVDRGVCSGGGHIRVPADVRRPWRASSQARPSEQHQDVQFLACLYHSRLTSRD